MDLREELDRLIAKHEKFAIEDEEKAKKYELIGNMALNFYMKGRSETHRLAIEDLEHLLNEVCSNG